MDVGIIGAGRLGQAMRSVLRAKPTQPMGDPP